jgi:hypothetical protein
MRYSGGYRRRRSGGRRRRYSGYRRRSHRRRIVSSRVSHRLGGFHPSTGIRIVPVLYHEKIPYDMRQIVLTHPPREIKIKIKWLGEQWCEDAFFGFLPKIEQTWKLQPQICKMLNNIEKDFFLSKLNLHLLLQKFSKYHWKILHWGLRRNVMHFLEKKK